MTGPLQVIQLAFRNGTDYTRQTDIDTSSIIVFVGPNNSGKSTALTEIQSGCSQRPGYYNPNPSVTAITKIIADVKITSPTDDVEGIRLLLLLGATHMGSPRSGPNNERLDEYEVPNYNFLVSEVGNSRPPNTSSQTIKLQDLHDAISQNNMEWLRTNLVKLFVVRLDGRTRFNLADPKPSGDLQGRPSNHLWALFTNDEARQKVRQLTEEAFGLHFVIDPTGMNEFRPRLSARAPITPAEEQSLDAVSRQFHSQAKTIAEFGDGVKAFIGLVSAVMSLPHKIMLIDEPEAFLYPPLARRLGRNLAKLASERQASLITATHSSDFLLGCMETTPDTTIIRLTYENGSGTARALSPLQVKQLMLDPLLRSTSALRGLFHRAVIVTEADRDRAFYDEINRRLQESGRGVDDGLFVNAQNWQTVARVVAPLRSLGIPAAAIMDFDTLSDPSSWHDIYKAANMDSGTETTFERRRAQCEVYLKNLALLPTGQKAFKVYGLQSLSGAEQSAASSLVDDLEEYGIFIVAVGEVERWLDSLIRQRVTKKEWLVEMFEALGSDPAAPTYVNPGSDDVWAFLDKVGKWVGNATRKGMPP